MNDIFNEQDVDHFVTRIQKLTSTTTPQWGKMSVDQMLAHCNVTYELVFENKYPKPGAFKKFLLKLFVKQMVVGDKPYKKNSPTSQEFIISNPVDFEIEKNRLINYLNKTKDLGESYFNNKESHSFGKLTAQEWNNMFSKHLEHHLGQFGV